MRNLWAKEILRVFKLASGLGVNFHKSGFIGIYVDPSLLLLVYESLYYKIEYLLSILGYE